ncbi:hypothetical protein [Flammeovirga kamogawensis]|uniref:Uncharacterized protein n=1 Tax=Flammeovirga kamogawensis TaxID=373891 RepID=A0ABX8GW06_9BACT|nr:hypothetical protein [Flammeovirga kamogawensis]MBB6459610.1 hypothetical protein [Flammeovirga kamogawensis]QWG07327.1 hypothetical protein KM029_18785 [Flammeovirga kamogawensis]TRX69144.1 hypothetical protein EO216_13785 [Flammeovirga kamogawensis]
MTDITKNNYINNMPSERFNIDTNYTLHEIVEEIAPTLNFQSMQEVIRNTLLIFNVDYREHLNVLTKANFHKKKSIESLLHDFNFQNTDIASSWIEFIECLEIEASVYVNNSTLQ